MLISRQLRGEDGFALPTILIASTILMIVLAVAATAATSISVSLANQYYNQLAHEAAESILAEAGACVKANGAMPSTGTTYTSWGTQCGAATSGNISQGGVAVSNYPSVTIVYNSQSGIATQATATVTSPTTIQATGYAYRFRPDGTVWQTYTAQENTGVTTTTSPFFTAQTIAAVGGSDGSNSNGSTLALTSSSQLYVWGSRMDPYGTISYTPVLNPLGGGR